MEAPVPELGVDLEEEHAGVAEHEAGDLGTADRAAEVEIVGRGVVRHFWPGAKS